MLFIHGDKLDGGYVQYSLPEELSGKRMDQCWDSWNLSLSGIPTESRALSGFGLILEICGNLLMDDPMVDH